MKLKKHAEKSRLLILRGKELLVLQKLQQKKKYVLPGGFLKKSESPEEALQREVEEELGVSIDLLETSYLQSVTLSLEDHTNLTKHYYVLFDGHQPFMLNEPHKFSKLKWLHWRKAIKYMGRTDKTIIENLFIHQLNTDSHGKSTVLQEYC